MADKYPMQFSILRVHYLLSDAPAVELYYHDQ